MKSHQWSLAVFTVLTCLGAVRAQDSAPSSHLVFNDNFDGDIIINEVRVPKSGEAMYTYYEALGWRGGGAGYAGIQVHPRAHNFIFSIWDHKSHTAPIKAVYRGPGTETKGFGGEGTGLKSWNFELGWSTDVWYTLVARNWPVGEHTYYGFWVRAGDTKKWTHLVTMDVGTANAHFTGSTDAFIEDWLNTGAKPRTTNLRRGWKRKIDGTWFPFGQGRYSVNSWDLVSGKRSYNYRTNWNGGVSRDATGDYYFMTSGGAKTAPTTANPSKHAIRRKETKPDYHRITISKIQLKLVDPKTLLVTWATDETTVPQFSYQIEIHDNRAGKGVPLVSASHNAPHVREEVLDVSSLTLQDTQYYLHLRCNDVLDRKSDTKVAVLGKGSLSNAQAPNNGSRLAMTPPMGWNSWNAFEKDIDEKKIRAIADAMVDSGMRDAGYTYLVLDDAWMAKQRDKNGRLVADPKKFPGGMKAIGDYIHGKGLKYGIYQDRGKMTCQQLPGSFGHEQTDMNTFAEWGIDYIKMDSCFAESNGRMSSEDYAIYRKHIAATGRPMVLSISDFGNAAWAWGGKESSQLWRTSHDIYPWMDSIYACADTSAGDRAIHPAFNGLWQFAGPGHWNDPDMLQVGNLKDMEEDRQRVADRAHFSLWCILAAPLMAGNDLRTMTEDVRNVLTAPELIAVNQDRRGIQGYKIFSQDGREVYNKPLADGTTAVLLLNKHREKTDITVRWDQIGLSGSQPVRDLWARKDLGKSQDAFTASNLGQHEHRMIKVGRLGPLLPTPVPMPLEKYTVPRQGETYLSDLYYIWKAHNAPVYDTTFSGDPITIGSQTFKKGFGCKGKSAFMFKVNGLADRFRAVVAMDKSSEENAEGRFRVYNEDFFANKVLWDSGKMTKDSPAKAIDIELKDVQCLMLVFDGNKFLGNWASARVTNENKSD